MTETSSVLDQLEKLFALKNAGVLTDAEFEAEKALILNAGRPEGRNDAADDFEGTGQADAATEPRRNSKAASAKAIAVLMLFLAVGLIALLAVREDWFSGFEPEVDQSSAGTDTENKVGNAGQLQPDDAMPEDAGDEPVFSWSLISNNQSLTALFGGEATSASFALDCLTGERQIEFTEYDLERPANLNGRITTGQSQGYAFSGYYNDEDAYPYFAFKIPADHELWAELAKGGSDLTVVRNGAEPYDLPSSPILADFISKCRAKM